MLRQMRNFSRSWLAYGLLFLLAVAFAIWGVNDVFSGVGGRDVAKVGDRTISAPELSRELSLALRQERDQGANFTQQEAIDAGYHTRLLDSMILRLSIADYAKKNGVDASDALVAQRLRQMPVAINQVSGQFDPISYQSFLTTLGYSSAEFEDAIRVDLGNQMVMRALTSGLRAPSSYGALVLAYETESRVVTVVEAPASLVGQIAAPTDAQLQTFYQENTSAFAVPEYRQLTIVRAAPQDFVQRVPVTEERLREEFEERRASLSTPEQRTYTRITAQNEAQANEIAQRLTRGESPAAIASALDVQMTRGENQRRADVPDSRVGEAVFAQAAGSAPQVVRGALAPWVVVRVEAVTPGTAPDFNAARESLRQEIALHDAAELLNTAIGVFEDARAGGASVTEAATQAGLPYTTLPLINSHGDTTEGVHPPEIGDRLDLVAAAFQTEEGETTDFLPTGEADVMIAVDRVVHATTRPFAEVETQLRGNWLMRERARRLRELGAEISQAVAGGQSFAAAARARRANIVISSQALDRRTAAQLPARGLAAQIFQAGVGEVVSEVRADGGLVLLAQVEAINRIDVAEAPQLVEAARGQAAQSLAQSLDESVQMQISATTRTERFDRAITRLFPPSSAQAGNE